MRKEICLCDVCKTQISASKSLEIEMMMNREIAEKLGLGEYAHQHRRRRWRRRKCTMVYVDVCSKECFIRLLEAIKNAEAWSPHACSFPNQTRSWPNGNCGSPSRRWCRCPSRIHNRLHAKTMGSRASNQNPTMRAINEARNVERQHIQDLLSMRC